jgi:CheY-like chemotaxis protein
MRTMTQASVIIVEDDAMLGEIFAAVLETAGLKVELLADGSGAYESIAAQQPSLVILDMHLPHVSGLDILAQVRANPALAHTPVIVVSADAQMAQQADAQADAIMLKPVSKQQILSIAKHLTTD